VVLPGKINYEFDINKKENYTQMRDYDLNKE